MYDSKLRNKLHSQTQVCKQLYLKISIQGIESVGITKIILKEL